MARIESPRIRLHGGATLIVLAALAGCATPPAEQAPSAAATAAAAPARAADDVSAVRRCVDNLLLDSGMREVSLVVDQVSDATRPGDTSAREALVSVLSDMTQRSRTVRVVAPGTVAGTTPAPQYALRGTLRAEGGGAALGLDLTLLSARDMSVVAGTASHNVVNVIAPGAGRAARAASSCASSARRSAMAAATPAAATRALLELARPRRSVALAKVAVLELLRRGRRRCGGRRRDPGLVRHAWPRGRPRSSASSRRGCAIAGCTTGRSTAPSTRR